ncbi:MAG TPA: hypothetical protein PKD59_13015 [Miltoncostaeaceae bacterium]|nr:hypothetical protein [Miltoncostaeaceae bacterium]
MRTRTLLLTAAMLTVGAQTALGVCGPPAARTLAVTDSARIYAVPGATPTAPTTISGCHLETGGRAIPIAKQLTRTIRYGKRRITQRLIVQQPRLAGSFAAVAVRNFDAVGRGRTTIRIVDLRTGAVAASTRTAPSGAARDWTVTDLGVSTDGRAAWIARYRPDPSQSQVFIKSAGVDATSIDSGNMDPLSLEITELLQEDGHLDVSVDYTKDGGASAGNSGIA